jgi:L-threonylcarbamoyladenylate synthase
MKIVNESEKNAVVLACEFLRAGKVISFATDTVYGIAVDATNFKAVEALYKIKQRDKKKPIAIFVKDLTTAKKIFFFDEVVENFLQENAKKSLTIVLKKDQQGSSILAKNLNQNDDFLGFRIVDCDFVKKLMAEFNGILAVTSANKTGKKAAKNIDEVKQYFTTSELDLIVDGGESKADAASTVVKIDNKKITILRL